MKTKTLLTVLVLCAAVLAFAQVVYAKDVITGRTGTIRITKPDGAVLTVNKSEPLPAIPSGSTVEILDGSMYVSPKEGFIKVIAGNSVTNVEAGDRVIANINKDTGLADFKVNAGEINIVVGNTTVTVGTNQRVRTGLNSKTGVAEVRSVKGRIKTVTVGIVVSVPEGVAAKISADPNTRLVHVESVGGTLEVVSVNGKIMLLADGKTVDLSGYVVGEIQTFTGGMPAISLTEEPAEPERQEGSNFLP